MIDRVVATPDEALRDVKDGATIMFPLTASGAVDLIVTDLAVIEVEPEGLVLREVAPGVSPEDVQ